MMILQSALSGPSVTSICAAWGSVASAGLLMILYGFCMVFIVFYRFLMVLVLMLLWGRLGS